LSRRFAILWICEAASASVDHARKLATQARDPAAHYQHSEIGYNYRLSNLLAAVGRGQSQVLSERVRRKREIFQYYADTLGDLPGITLMPEAPWGRCTRWLTFITVDPAQFGADREDIYRCSDNLLEWRLQPVALATEKDRLKPRLQIGKPKSLSDSL